MRSLLEAAELRETPAVGAYQLWHFVTAYRNTAKVAPSVVLLFIAMGILNDKHLSFFFRKLRNHIKTLQQNLKEAKSSDLLTTITQKTKRQMDYTSAAIDIAVGARLLYWDFENATLHPIAARTSGINAEEKMLSKHALTIGTDAAHLGKIFGNYGDEHKLVSEMGVKL